MVKKLSYRSVGETPPRLDLLAGASTCCYTEDVLYYYKRRPVTLEGPANIVIIYDLPFRFTKKPNCLYLLPDSSLNHLCSFDY